MIDLDGDSRTVLARRHTDSAEAWLRLLVHRSATAKWGETYVTAGPWKQAIRTYVETKVREEPGKYLREIDATTFDQIVDMVCHPDHWVLWSDGLRQAYPDGRAEARTFLQRLRAIRNDLAHGQVCSTRQLEQAVCYANDLADSVKAHWRRLGLEREFNVPTFVRVYDNLNNDEHLAPGPSYRVANFSDQAKSPLYPGDTLVAEVIVDPSFDASEYDVVWLVKTRNVGRIAGTTARLEIEVAHVGERMELQFRLTTKRDWHRRGDVDDVLDLYYRVLPPPP